MKNLIIVGAGGFAKEIIGYINHDKSIGLLQDINLKGILVDYEQHYINLNMSLKYLGKIREYEIKKNDTFIIAIGENPGRSMIVDYFESKNAIFFNYIHSSCYVNPTSKIGSGLIMTPFSIIDANVILGKHALISIYSAIGHDCVIGDNLIMYSQSIINGHCIIGNNLTMGTKSTIFPKVKLGNNCVITSHSFVKSNKGDNRFIHQKTKEIDLENR